MVGPTSSFAAAVRRRPVVVVVATLLVSVVLAYFAGQAVREDRVSVETARSAALATIDEHFGDRSSVLQVLVRGEHDVRSVDGLRTSIAIQQAVTASDVASTLVDGSQPPPIVSYLSGVERMLDQHQRSVDEMSDSDVLELADRAAEQLPDDVARLLEQLTADTNPVRTGLILIFQDTEGLDDTQQREQQAALARVVGSVETPDGIVVEPFSFGLLLERDGDVGVEVVQLFGGALGAVLLLLALVYWRATPGGGVARLRRTFADVGLTLAVIALAVVWTQGMGVLLGPDHLAVVGYFSPSSQIVPILVVGLGVDFAIHLLARYRDERRGGATAVRASDHAIATVGISLSLGALATATGFLTNLASPLDFLAMLGVLAAVGVLSAFVLATTFLPAVRVLLDRRVDVDDGAGPTDAATGDPHRRPAIASAAWLAERAPVPTLVVATLVAGIGAFGTTQLDSHFDVADFVSRDEPMLDSYRTLTEEFAGGFDGQVEILLTGNLFDPDAHNALVDVHDQLSDLNTLHSGVGGVTSPVSTLRHAHDAGELGEELAARDVHADGTVVASTDLRAIYRQLAERGIAGDVVDLDGSQPIGRVVIDTPVPPGHEGDVLAELDTALAPLAAHGIHATATSQELIEHQLTEEIADSQIASLLIALAAATALLALHYRRTRRRGLLGALTVAPAALVVTVTLAAMAATGIPLNPVTATLAALSIGIAVPFAIHVTNRYLEERTHEDGPAGAVRRTLAGTGAALTASAATTAIGFGVLTTSSLLPFRQLGQVTLYAVGAALVAATLVLPSILTLWERRQPTPTTHDPSPKPQPAHAGSPS